MTRHVKGIALAGGASIAALALLLTPALAASSQDPAKAPAKRPPVVSFYSGSFTPAIADPRLAAEFARRGVQSDTFRFTPSSASPGKSKAVKVAIRARSSNGELTGTALTDATSASTVTAITPTAYNLGVSVGWKRFALSGDVARVEGGAIPGGREAAEVGVSYLGKGFTGRVAVGADRADPNRLRITPVDSSYSLDVGGSYRIARNLDVTGGVRYKIQRDRLEALAADDRQDSQSVYVGTAFRF